MIRIVKVNYFETNQKVTENILGWDVPQQKRPGLGVSHSPHLVRLSGICFLFSSKPASLCLCMVDIEQVGEDNGQRRCRVIVTEQDRGGDHTWLVTVLNLSVYYVTHFVHYVTAHHWHVVESITFVTEGDRERKGDNGYSASLVVIRQCSNFMKMDNSTMCCWVAWLFTISDIRI